MPFEIEPKSASERKGNTLKGFQHFYLTLKAIVWL